MNNLNRLFQFASNMVVQGPLYAIANARIHSPIPLEAAENWKFWNDQKSSWFESLVRAYPPSSRRKAYLDSMLAQDHANGIEAHYDISNEFYGLFLDTKYRFYTCAEFLSDTETLEEAQENKAKYLLSLLNISGSEKILDLGCGWGAMLRYLQDAGHWGELTGFTLSKEQLTYAREKLGLNVSLTNFITAPFENALYDRILSIGALEHVRPKELQQLYQKIYDALAPQGLAVHQFFSFEREPYPASAILLQLFFPGSLLVIHRHHIEAAESVGFRITHDSIHDYKPTIRAWYERLVENQARALELVGLEIYNRYMTFFPVAWLFFVQKEAELHRIVMEKSSH
ncbi:SAM-dependent methyltransferase [Calothrix sp. UHCC 0171]|uniref:SAM-dependent methyltransferase n=1 Tax=Calothrix sp. UHCC 0171 TaxID=3110245 RepID=UPI002B1EBA12|nr:class I SAM-dependent methyltransferase [Calothrix sp. UHCC 0171]MEA5572182.1 class I SAM-dependent methyltransferase [Calothrix sp. UHCC 0171]